MKHTILLLLLVGSLMARVTDAAVFKCVNPSGLVEFRDRPCQLDTEFQARLPISSQKTQTAVVKQQALVLHNQEKALNKDEKKAHRLQKKLEQQREKDCRKAKRLELRCKTLREKIKEIERRLRAGCSGKRAQRLRDKELQLIAQEREVCVKS